MPIKLYISALYLRGTSCFFTPQLLSCSDFDRSVSTHESPRLMLVFCSLRSWCLFRAYSSLTYVPYSGVLGLVGLEGGQGLLIFGSQTDPIISRVSSMFTSNSMLLKTRIIFELYARKITQWQVLSIPPMASGLLLYFSKRCKVFRLISFYF